MLKRDMEPIDIRRLDFGLLSVLASLLRTRKATATAAELAMTQSTVSHALGRLRDLFQDDLFVRRPHGLEPTPKALLLAPKVESLFGVARDLFDEGPFQPAEAVGVVRIGASDYHCALHSAPLIARLHALAPKLKTSFRPLVRRDAIEALIDSSLEVAIGRFWDLPSSVVARPLFNDTYSVVGAVGHPKLAAAPDLETYLKLRHIVVSLDGDLTGVVDDALRRMGRRREVVSAVPYFLSALAAVSDGEAVVTLPTRIATTYGPRFGLVAHPPPVALRAFEVSAVASAARAKGDVVRWLIDEVLPETVD